MGADQAIHNLVKDTIEIVIHPPRCDTMRAYCSSTQIRSPQDYLIRNRNIVDETDVLLAFPATFHEVIRSGTWATIRYAKKMNKRVIIVYPDENHM